MQVKHGGLPPRVQPGRVPQPGGGAYPLACACACTWLPRHHVQHALQRTPGRHQGGPVRSAPGEQPRRPARPVAGPLRTRLPRRQPGGGTCAPGRALVLRRRCQRAPLLVWPARSSTCVHALWLSSEATLLTDALPPPRLAVTAVRRPANRANLCRRQAVPLRALPCSSPAPTGAPLHRQWPERCQQPPATASSRQTCRPPATCRPRLRAWRPCRPSSAPCCGTRAPFPGLQVGAQPLAAAQACLAGHLPSARCGGL